MADVIDHPPHYTAHASGIECIQITECLPFCLGNAVKYAWRAGLKGAAAEDLQKAAWYLRRQASAQDFESHIPLRLRERAEIVLAHEPEDGALYAVLSLLTLAWLKTDEIRSAARIVEAIAGRATA